MKLDTDGSDGQDGNEQDARDTNIPPFIIKLYSGLLPSNSTRYQMVCAGGCNFVYFIFLKL